MNGSRSMLAAFLLLASVGAAPGQGKEDKPARPLRVLLFADAPTREYHFVRDFYVREFEAKKVDLRIHLQSADKESDQYVPPERLIPDFPALAGRGLWPSECDLVIAFDPDWTRVPAARQAMLKDWVLNQGGGLVVVAGPVHSYRLSRPGSFGLNALDGLLPVRLLDTRVTGTRVTGGFPMQNEPHALSIRDERSGLLKIDKNSDEAAPAWEKFHAKASGNTIPVRGFFSAAPVATVHPRAQVVASLIEPGNKEFPFIVTMAHGKGRVIFVASGELWRLRSYNQDFHTRLWQNFADFATKRGVVTVESRIFVGERHVEEDRVTIETMLVDKTGNALDADAKPKLRLVPPLESKLPAVTFTMTAKYAGPGMEFFQAVVPVTEPGEYLVEVTAPAAKIEVAGKFTVRSYLEAHKQDGRFLLRQYDLARRAQLFEQGLLALSNKLKVETDPAMVKEGKVLRAAVDMTAAWHARHVQAAGALRDAKKLAEFQFAHKESQGLEEKVRSVRMALLGTDASSPALLALTKAEESLARVREMMQANLRDAEVLLQAKPDAKWGAYQFEVNSGALDTAIAKMKGERGQLKSAAQDYGKKLDALAAAGVRPETARYLKVEHADALATILDKDFDGVIAVLTELSKQQSVRDPALKLRGKARNKLAGLQNSLDFLPAANLGVLFVELTSLEAEQARQSRALGKIKDRIESDLLKQLLDGN